MDTARIDFIGIGAPRSGTTWIAECLRQHPDVRLPLRTDGSTDELDYADLTDAKELNFFTVTASDGTYFPPLSNWHKGREWYLHRFPPAEKGKVRGEMTPDYLRDPASPRLIWEMFPEVKLIVSLRDPVDMVYSLYMLHSYGAMKGSFEEMLDRGLYMEPGLYAKHLSRYLELFPRENIHVILFDDIAADPGRVVRELYAFLDVDAAFTPTVLEKKVNTAKIVRSPLAKSVAANVIGALRRYAKPFLDRFVPQNGMLYRAYFAFNLQKRSYAPMRAETRGRLRAYFKDDIEELERLIGRDLSAWKTK